MSYLFTAGWSVRPSKIGGTTALHYKYLWMNEGIHNRVGTYRDLVLLYGSAEVDGVKLGHDNVGNLEVKNEEQNHGNSERAPVGLLP